MQNNKNLITIPEEENEGTLLYVLDKETDVTLVTFTGEDPIPEYNIPAIIRYEVEGIISTEGKKAINALHALTYYVDGAIE